MVSFESFTGAHEFKNINKSIMSDEVKCLSIVATPIGNLKDISERAIQTIKNAEVVICENPNHSLKLLNNLGIKKKLVSLHDYNEKRVVERISEDLISKNTVLISDAGSPLISDPGYKLIDYCIKNNINVTSIPGPTSIIPSLQLSGIPINEFHFTGFFPKSSKLIENFVLKIKETRVTTVFFVSSHKLKTCLKHLEKKLPDRKISIAKELTKINEKVFRGVAKNVGDQLSLKKESFKGEFVIVVEGKAEKETNFVNLEVYNEQIIKLISKFSLTDVVEIVHKLTRIKKNAVYKWVLSLKK